MQNRFILTAAAAIFLGSLINYSMVPASGGSDARSYGTGGGYYGGGTGGHK